ncbi:MAG: nucleoside-diphosphate kinase [Oligoflexia bacterium]|nr:nucleoside-diphosphate kinase [Oligoflexia bacterium]
MQKEKTLCIIKPNAVSDNNIGNIIARYEKEGLRISAIKMAVLTKEKAEGFYIEHKERPFFSSLVTFMTSGVIVLMVLEGEDAVTKNRKIMGATNPVDAAPNTLRGLYARSMEANAVHGSDSIPSAEREISYFFTPEELYNRF